MLNIFVIFTFFGNLILGIFVYLKDKRNKLNRSFALISFSVALWIISAYMFWVSNDALFWGKMMFVGPITLGIAFPYFMRVFPPRNSTLKIHYKVLFLFPFVLLIALTPTNFFVKEIIYPSREVIYGMGNAVFGVYFMTYMGYAFFMLIKKRLNATGINRDQLNYLLIGTLVTTIAGSITNLLLPLLGTSQFNRLGPSSTIVFIVATAYAIVKYRLMDIRVIVSNITIFIGVYTLVLGIPIYLYILGYKLISLITMGILATLGPVIYSILRKQAEDKIFEEQRQYQTTLRNASLGMAQIKDLNHLVRLIVHIVLRAVRIENCKIFLFHEDSSKYILKASKGRKETTEVVDSIKSNHELTEQLKKIEGPLVFEEIKQRAVDFNDSSLKTVEQIMIQLGADVIIPSFIEKKLIAFLVLGKKVSGQLYSQDDLSVFSILANQAALAIENAMFYEQTQKTTEQLFRAEKMATIGTMADGLSHQINNRLHAVGFVAGDALDSLKLFIKKKNRFGSRHQAIGRGVVVFA